jgi:hypothetical protein
VESSTANSSPSGPGRSPPRLIPSPGRAPHMPSSRDRGGPRRGVQARHPRVPRGPFSGRARGVGALGTWTCATGD